MSLRLPQLGRHPDAPFPPADTALREPDGLLAWGGDLHPERLANAYRHGIFPWYSEGQPILWWTPDPRTVFRTDTLHIPRRLLRTMRSEGWTVTADTAFEAVLAACAHSPRRGQDGTWITDAMAEAYTALHRRGCAHSIEVRAGGTLVGGLYGVAIGAMVFGESMFSARSGGSRVALCALAAFLRARGCPLIDAQVENPHLRLLGAESMPRTAFLREVARLVGRADLPRGAWTTAFGTLDARSLAEAPAASPGFNPDA